MGRTCILLLLFMTSALALPARFVDSLSVVPVTITNETDEQQIYMLDCDRWATADLTYRIDGGPELHKKTGEFLPVRERDYQFAKAVMMRIVLGPGETLTGELRRTQQSYLGPPPANEEFKILTEKEAASEIWGLIAFGLVAASILLFIFIYNFTFFMVTKNRLYRFYLPGVIFMIFETLRESGVLTWIFSDWAFYPMAEQYVAGTLILLIMIFSPLFMYDLMDAPNRFPKLYRAFPIFIFVCVILYGLLYWDFRIATDIFTVVLPPFTALLVYGVVVNMIRKYQYSRPIFVVICVLGFSTSFQSLGIAGFLPFEEGVFIRVGILGFIFADSIMAFTLGRIMWDLRMENIDQKKRLVANLRKEQKTLQRIAHTVSETQEKERNNFAQRLHDDLQNQLVTLRYLILGLQAAPPQDQTELEKREAQLMELTDESIRKTKEIAFEIMPDELRETDGFFPAIHSFLDRFAHLDIQLERSLSGNPKLPLQIRSMAFRMVQELVTNALKHANAQEIKVTISHNVHLLKIKVEDNGSGFPEGLSFDTEPTGLGRGIESIYTNVAMYGGWFSIEPGKGNKGACISIVIPTEIGENVTYPASLN